jgi:hypothetical protein
MSDTLITEFLSLDKKKCLIVNTEYGLLCSKDFLLFEPNLIAVISPLCDLTKYCHCGKVITFPSERITKMEICDTRYPNYQIITIFCSRECNEGYTPDKYRDLFINMALLFHKDF